MFKKIILHIVVQKIKEIKEANVACQQVEKSKVNQDVLVQSIIKKIKEKANKSIA